MGVETNSLFIYLLIISGVFTLITFFRFDYFKKKHDISLASLADGRDSKGNAVQPEVVKKINGKLWQFRGSLLVTVLLSLFYYQISNKVENTTNNIVQPANTNASTSPNYSSDNSNSIKKDVEHTCNICERKFTGDGYCEGSDGTWRPCEYPYSSNICSPSCGIKSVQKLQDIIDDHVNKVNTSLCTTCSFGHYKNGFCDYCGIASQERVNQSLKKMPDCPLCKGTGIEKPMGANSLGEDGRICPMCNGTGKQSY